ncbi:MAG TPA: hypothetical protein VGK54_04455 [Chloroflexota bacterium]
MPEMSLSDRAQSELRQIVTHYSAAEAEVVREFLSRPHEADEYLDVLLRQAGREIHAACSMTRALRMLDNLEDSVDRYALYDQMERMADEVKHYCLIADIAEEIAGRKLGQQELLKYWVFAVYDPMVPEDKLYNPRLPEANRYLGVSRELMDKIGWDRGRPLTRMAEGGGGGAFEEAARHGSNPFEVRFAEVMGRIFADEVHHGPETVAGYVEHFVHSDSDLDEAKLWLTRFLSQHLRIRNEIYHNPLSPDRLAAIDTEKLHQ